MSSPCHRAIGSGAIGWALGVVSVALAVVFVGRGFVAAPVVVVLGSSWTASLASMPPWYDHVLTNQRKHPATNWTGRRGPPTGPETVTLTTRDRTGGGPWRQRSSGSSSSTITKSSGGGWRRCSTPRTTSRLSSSV